MKRGKARPSGVRIEFERAAHEPASFPAESRPEVAFVGRSNVGKSSLLNALKGGAPVARTSRTPGRTRSVNFYRVDAPVKATIVDLPGYGFARVSKEERKHWKTVVDAYLTRNALRIVILLVDAKVGPTALDRTMSEWLRERRLRTLVAVTKVDKLARAAGTAAVRAAADALGIDSGAAVGVSATTGEGVAELWRAVRERLAADGREELSPRT